jgi:hypothetical protein
MGRIMVQGQPRQNVSETPSQPIKLVMVVHTCHPSYVGGINRRIMVQADLYKNVRLHLKNN